MGNSPINRDHKMMATPHILTSLPESCIILFKCVSSPPIAPQTDKIHCILDVSCQALLQVCVCVCVCVCVEPTPTFRPNS
jgi:hypothetical protein